MTFEEKISASLGAIGETLAYYFGPARRLALIAGPIREQGGQIIEQPPSGANMGAEDLETITTTQEIPYTLEVRNSMGGPAEVDGVPTWDLSDDSVASVAVAADGMSAVVRGNPQANVTEPIPVTLTVTADADLGAGTVPLTGVATVTVAPAGATVIELTAGAPVEQAPA